MFTKWTINIDRLNEFRFAEDKSLWKLPYVDKAGKSRSAKKIKKQSRSRWVLNGEPWSEDQLRPHLRLDENPIELYKENEMPF